MERTKKSWPENLEVCLQLNMNSSNSFPQAHHYIDSSSGNPAEQLQKLGYFHFFLAI